MSKKTENNHRKIVYMNGIGVLIKNIRLGRKISVKELAENICSEKFIYLIENGERNPSVSILAKIGYKLGVELIEYLPYLTCDNPDFMKKIIDQFEIFRFNREFNKLNQITFFLRDDIDFQKDTWSCELDYNIALYRLFEAAEYVAAYKIIKIAIDKLGGTTKNFENIELHSLILTKFYNLLVICFYETKELELCDKLIKPLYQEVHKKKNITSFNEIYISVATNYYFRLLEKKELEGLDFELFAFKDYQMKNNKFSRLYLTYFLLAQWNHLKCNIQKKAYYIDLMIKFGDIIEPQKDYEDLMKFDFIQDYLMNK